MKDAEGEVVSTDELMAWMVENVSIPIFSLYNEVVVNGAVGGLVMSEEDQGEAAGQMMVRIAQGAHPSSVSERLSAKNLLAINLAAARRWNLPIPIAFPLAGRVYRELPSAEPGEFENLESSNPDASFSESGQKFSGDTWYNYGYNMSRDPGMMAEHESWVLRGGP